MKRISSLIQIILAALLLLGGTSHCHAQCDRKITHKMAVFIDVTDAEHLDAFRQYVSTEFEQLVGFFENSNAFGTCHQAVVYVYPLNDKGENRVLTSTSKLVDANMTETQVERKVKPPFIEAFKNHVRKVLNAPQKESPELDSTRIYEPLCLLLNEHSETGQPLHIVVYSDLMEHNQVSFYRKGQPIPVEKTLEALRKSCHCTLPADLSFLRLHLISFRTSENDRVITAAREFWKSVFNSRKAKVYTGTGFQLSHSRSATVKK